jgi:hypothetical protein
VDSLKKIISDHTLIFEPAIYVWPAGSTTYQIYDPWNNSSGVNVINDLEVIPSQSLFMIRVLSGYSQNGIFSLEKNKVLRHGSAAHNTLRASVSEFQDEVLFKVSPASNPNVYDLTAVGLRPNAKVTFDSKDKEKMWQENSSTFLLYSLSTDNRKLSANVVPPGTHNVKLCLYPGNHGGEMTITASRTESIDQVWLEDLLTNEYIDLKQQDSYTFTSAAEDTPERFIVHFSNAPTALEEVEDTFLQGYYFQNELVIKGLKEKDINSTISIVDLQGRILQRATVTQAPEMHIPVNLSDGVYLAKLQGERTITVKFRKGGNQ